MKVTVKRGDVVYTCTNEEQLKTFLAAGYTEVTTQAASNAKPKKEKK